MAVDADFTLLKINTEHQLTWWHHHQPQFRQQPKSKKGLGIMLQLSSWKYSSQED